MLKKLLLRSNKRSRLWASLIALSTGTTLLLLSVMIWNNFGELLYGKNQNESLGSTFLIIGKKVTEENMGQPGATAFTAEDINAVKSAPQVQDVGLITSNHFPVWASMGGSMGFATDLPLECVPDGFIDHLPADWKWQPGDKNLPIIMPSQFLDIYNYVFAPSQGLPQLSERSVKAIGLQLKAGNPDNNETFIARVVGFSDRIGSVLAPQSFIEYGNAKYNKPGSDKAPSQLILKTKDPSDTRFTKFIEDRQYSTNMQNLRWSKMRSVVEVVTTATGVLAILLMGIGTLVFVLFIELTVARAQQSLQLLIELGHSPARLTKFMARKFLPMTIGTAIIATLIACAAQYMASQIIAERGLNISPLPGWPVWAALAVSTTLLLILITSSIGKAIRTNA